MDAAYLDLMDALKATAWERAKAELRSLVTTQGCYATTEGATAKYRARELDQAVTNFIAEIEDRGLAE